LPFAVALCFSATQVRAQQDTWSGVERIVAVGDVHGDFTQFVKVLRAAGVIDANENWIAGRTHLVQMGDVLDRGPDSRKAMDLLLRLEAQAAEANGAVHALIGNHEAMILLDDWRYVHEGEIKAFGGEEEYRKAMSAKGKYGRWIRGHNAVVKINDILFAHAGITLPYARMTVADINKAVREALTKSDANGILMDSAGPLWDRILALDDEELVAKDLDAVFSSLGARRMVIGHTVETEGVVTRADGRLIRIDVGLSGLYGGPAACLVVEKGVFYEVREGGKKPRLLFEASATRPAATQPATRPASTRAAA
jgi:Icc-related predicted phosphoesterase